MARIVDYQQLPSGGYLAMGDDGQAIPTAYLPPAIKMGIDAQKQSGMVAPPAQLRADIAEAATAPQDDQRVAMMGPIPSAVQQNLVEQRPDVALPAGAPAAAAAGENAWKTPAGAPTPPTTPGIVPPDQRVQLGGQRPAPISFAGGGARVIPGGERKVGEVMGTTSYDPDAQANVKRGYQNQWEATQKAGEAQQQGDIGEANVMSQIPEGLRNLEAQRQDAEAIRQQSMASDMDKMNQLRAESRQDVDPGRIWHSQSEGTKFWGALMVGLGQLSAGMTGQPNVALGIMNKAIDNDIDAQKANIANKRDQLHDQQSLYKDNLARFQDARQAEVATKAQYLEHAQAQLAALKAQAKAPEDQAKIDLLSADIQKEAAKNDMEFTKITHQVHTQVVPDRVVGGGPNLENLNRSLVVQDLGGKKFLARGENEAKDLNTKRAMSQTAIRAADTMRRISETPGFEKLDPTSPLIGEFNFAREQFINSANSLAGQGIVRGEDIERYSKDILGGAYGLATAKKAEALAGKIHQGYSAVLESSADTDTSVKEAPEVDPKTGTIRKGVHYDAGELLSGQRQGGQVDFTPAGGKR